MVLVVSEHAFYFNDPSLCLAGIKIIFELLHCIVLQYGKTKVIEKETVFALIDLFQNSPKVNQFSFWATLVSEFVTKNF